MRQMHARVQLGLWRALAQIRRWIMISGGWKTSGGHRSSSLWSSLVGLWIALTSLGLCGGPILGAYVVGFPPPWLSWSRPMIWLGQTSSPPSPLLRPRPSTPMCCRPRLYPPPRHSLWFCRTPPLLLLPRPRCAPPLLSLLLRVSLPQLLLPWLPLPRRALLWPSLWVHLLSRP